MAICDRNGLPISIRVESGERHETQLVEDALSDCFASQLPDILVGDKAYDSDQLDMQLRRYGVMMVSPHRSTTKRKTQDGRHLRRYRHRWKVERFFSWLKKFRRLCNRWEFKATNFLGFLRLGCAVMLFRRL